MFNIYINSTSFIRIKSHSLNNCIIRYWKLGFDNDNKKGYIALSPRSFVFIVSSLNRFFFNSLCLAFVNNLHGFSYRLKECYIYCLYSIKWKKKYNHSDLNSIWSIYIAGYSNQLECDLAVAILRNINLSCWKCHPCYLKVWLGFMKNKDSILPNCHGKSWRETYSLRSSTTLLKI